MYRINEDFRPYKKPEPGSVSAAEYAPVLRLKKTQSPIRIERIELLRNGPVWIVRTRSCCGLTGVCISNERLQYVYPILEKLIVPCLIGRDARDIEALMEEIYVYKNNYKLAGLAYYIALASVELSILDLLAKAEEVSLGQLFGERRKQEVKIYMASGNRGTTADEELEILARKVEATGAEAIKFKIGGRMSRNRDSIEGRSEQLIYKTREFFGDRMVIHADGNGSYDPENAIRYGALLEEINAYFYEEPCPFDDLEGTRQTADVLTIPLAFGEQETSMRRFAWLIENHGADVLQPDILYNGGMIRTARVARMAECAGMTVTPHVSTGFGFVYILHFVSFAPNAGMYQECKEGFELANDLMDGCLRLSGGRINIPDTVGTGINCNHSLIREAETIFSAAL